MIYTYDKNTGFVVMVSEAKNEYTNTDWEDFQADESVFNEWCANQESLYMCIVDGELSCKELTT